MQEEIEKLCIRCQTKKPLTEYNKDASRKDGLCPYCKPCKNSLKRNWHLRRRRQQVYL